jgi:hypothetical protein
MERKESQASTRPEQPEYWRLLTISAIMDAAWE